MPEALEGEVLRSNTHRIIYNRILNRLLVKNNILSKRRLIPHHQFKRNLLKNFLLATLLLFISLAIGTLGYMYFFCLGWIDGLLNASMILTGMGPVNVAHTDGAKLFASFYALYSGIAFLTSVAVIFAPVLHRFLHKFHLDLED